MEVGISKEGVIVRFDDETPDMQHHVRRHLALLTPGSGDNITVEPEGNLHARIANNAPLIGSIHGLLTSALENYMASPTEGDGFDPNVVEVPQIVKL